jgi:hypothetical protein
MFGIGKRLIPLLVNSMSRIEALIGIVKLKVCAILQKFVMERAMFDFSNINPARFYFRSLSCLSNPMKNYTFSTKNKLKKL